MYIFITIIFIAELIIALQLIALILKFDKKVCDINECVKTFNPLAQTCLQYIRCVAGNFCKSVSNSIGFVKKQHTKFIAKTIISTSVYLILLLFKFNRVKFKKVNKLIGAIKDIAIDLVI